MASRCKIELVAIFLFLSGGVAGQATVLTPTKLSCDWGIDPLGIDSAKPTLRWVLESTKRGATQSGYEVLVASRPDLLAKGRGDIWDSGKVESNENLDAAYDGPPLKSAERVYWKVRVWDETGSAAGWSALATWTMGILSEKDWEAAEWILMGKPMELQSTQAIPAEAAVQPPATIRLRKEFDVKPRLIRALVYVCGLGQYEMTMDGVKVGDDLLTPGWTDYRKTCLYDTYDVTAQLGKPGRHAMGLLLGNGMYNVQDGPRYHKFTGTYGPLMAKGLLRLEYADGSVEEVPTDGSWRAKAGPVTYSNEYGGEDYDARLEERGWDTPGYDDSNWKPAWQSPIVKTGVLRGFSHAAPPIRLIETLKGKPLLGNQSSQDDVVYDMGQNASVMPRIMVRGPGGSSVKITPAELLNADGSVDRESVGRGEAYWKYTLAGKVEGESYFPKFFYHGCRYLEVERIPPDGGGEMPEIDRVEGVVVHSTAPPAGIFQCSNDLYNRIAALVRWAQRSNMMSILTDCPHRERLGWMEQDHLNGPALRFDFQMDRFFNKVEDDIADAEHADGFVPEIAPEYVIFKLSRDANFHESVEWGSALLMVPQQQYEWTGDAGMYQEHYEAMKRYVDHLGNYAPGGVLNIPGDLGDWYDLGPGKPWVSQLTPRPLTETAFYYTDAAALAGAAQLLGYADDAEKYGRLAAGIREVFNERFYDVAKKQYGTGSQAADAIALVMGLVEPKERAAVLNDLVENVERAGNTAGDIGYRYVLRALADGGMSDVIGDMTNRSDRPGYGYQLKMGATSLTEAWDAARSSSQNHFMLGQIVEWFYHDLAGIQEDPKGPGFRRIIIRPQPAGGVTWVNASYDSVRGRITVDWSKEGSDFRLSVRIPPGSTATVDMPAKDASQVFEGGIPAAKAQGVKVIWNGPGLAIFKIESGDYEFTAAQ